MVLHVLRALFILLLTAVGWNALSGGSKSVGIAIAVGVLVVCIDILTPRKKLAIFAGTFLGLVVGVAIGYVLSFVVQLLVDLYITPGSINPSTVQFVILLVYTVCCYLAISFILQTKDDVRFIIPYVEFSKQTRGARPILLDTSVLIDGRIADVATTGILESQLVVPQFVLDELQTIADSPDKLKRNRGRRGLDVLSKLQGNRRVEVVLYSDARQHEADAGVDQKLMTLAKELEGRVLTNDYNLNKVAQLRGVDVININDLTNALKPVVLPGEKMVVRLVKPGESAGQGVGYLDDGTMVVVEQGRPFLNEEVEFMVTNAMQTSAGRMIFGRLPDAPGGTPTPPPNRRHPQRPRPDPQSTPG